MRTYASAFVAAPVCLSLGAAAAADSPYPPPPSFEGKVVSRSADGTWVSIVPPAPPPGPIFADRSVGPDVYIADGAENAIAVSRQDARVAIAVLNAGWLGTTSQANTLNTGATFTARAFPVAGAPYTNFPFDPWAFAGNSTGELYSSLMWKAATGPKARTLVARSVNSGTSFATFYEAVNRDVFQDRSMSDIDRTTALGGGAGTAHDGKVFLAFDDYGAAGTAYASSVVQIVSAAGALLSEAVVSTAATFRGSQIQPVAGVADGQAYLMSHSISGGGATHILTFHEISSASTLVPSKSTFNFRSVGQALGATSRFGVNGFRVGNFAQMAIDNSAGGRRGRLYVVTDRNPNPTNTALDQGDPWLSVSTDGALSWTTNAIPSPAPGKTQFFSMLCVDANGWVHVCYYQNEAGATNNGVLNAASVNVYYTYSRNGGANWSAPVRVNNVANSLDLPDPPPDRAAQSYYLVGDYCQVAASGFGGATRVYAHWTQYDKDRTESAVGLKKDRSYVTVIKPCPADFNVDGAVSVQDIFDFLAAYFGASPSADINGDGAVSVQDIFDFLAAYFVGCG